MPKVSVIIPTYNRAKYICEAIDSVLNQTYQDFEIIVVDDGSTDNTKEIIARYAQRNTQYIKYIYQENKGPSAARNLGIKSALGEYISFLDSDDTYLPEKLKAQVEFLEKNKSIGLVYAWWDYVNSKGRVLEYKGRRICKNDVTVEDMLLGRVNFNLCSFLFRKDCFQNELFDEGLRIGEDWDLWIRLAYGGFKFACIPKVLVTYRMHNNNICSNEERAVNDSLKMYDKVFKICKASNMIKNCSYYNLFYESSWKFYYKENHVEAKECMAKAVKLVPEVLNNKNTFNQWARNCIPLSYRNDSEVCKNLEIIKTTLFDFLNYIFANERLSNKLIKLKSVAYVNAHLALSELYYLSRDMEKAKQHFIAAFKTSSILAMRPMPIYTFLKSCLGNNTINKISSYKKSIFAHCKN